MIALETVLCPVDFSPATPRQVDLAAELSRTFGARLVLHHNRHSMGTVASVGWMWNADHHGDSQTVVEAKLRDCLSRVPEGVRAEPLTTEGPASRAVLAAGELVNADLVVPDGARNAGRRPCFDHAAGARGRRARGSRAARADGRASHATVRIGIGRPADRRRADRSRAARRVQRWSWGSTLTRQLPIELHLLHVLPGARVWRSHHAGSDEEVLGQLRALVPEELAARVKVHVEHGDVGHGIAAAAERLSAVCIVMGEHTRTAGRRWFGRDTPERRASPGALSRVDVPSTRAA